MVHVGFTALDGCGRIEMPKLAPAQSNVAESLKSVVQSSTNLPVAVRLPRTTALLANANKTRIKHNRVIISSKIKTKFKINENTKD